MLMEEIPSVSFSKVHSFQLYIGFRYRTSSCHKLFHINLVPWKACFQTLPHLRHLVAEFDVEVLHLSFNFVFNVQ